MSFRTLRRCLAVAVLFASVCLVASDQAASPGGDEITRKLKSKVAPAYPELARRMNISGVVKVQITVAPNGTVKNTKLIGGHPVLANSAMEAVKKWKYEPGADEVTGIVEFHFDPNQ